MLSTHSEFCIICKNRVNEEAKLKSFKLSRNLKEFKSRLESEFDLYLEGHTETVRSVAISSDNTYIISGSDDKTVRV